MADNKEEKNKLEREKSKAENSYKDACKKQQQFANQLKRLESAQRTVKELKRQYKDSMKKESKTLKQKAKWSGENYDILKNVNRVVLEDTNDKYYKSIDNIHDRLNEKIAEVKGKMDHYGILANTFLKTVRTVTVKIKNLTN